MIAVRVPEKLHLLLILLRLALHLLRVLPGGIRVEFPEVAQYRAMERRDPVARAVPDGPRGEALEDVPPVVRDRRGELPLELSTFPSRFANL